MNCPKFDSAASCSTFLFKHCQFEDSVVNLNKVNGLEFKSSQDMLGWVSIIVNIPRTRHCKYITSVGQHSIPNKLQIAFFAYF